MILGPGWPNLHNPCEMLAHVRHSVWPGLSYGPVPRASNRKMWLLAAYIDGQECEDGVGPRIVSDHWIRREAPDGANTWSVCLQQPYAAIDPLRTWTVALSLEDGVAAIGEIFGDMYWSVPAEVLQTWLDWNDETVSRLAKRIYQERAFDQMSILADALEESGCASEYVLDHARNKGALHVRGCWLVDLLLGYR